MRTGQGAALVRTSSDLIGYAAGMGEVTDRLEQALRGMIERDEYKPGDKLPSERDLVSQYGAGRTTVRLVLAKLAAQGLIEAQHGRGYFVCQPVRRRGQKTK